MNIDAKNTTTAADGFDSSSVPLDLVPASTVAAMERAAVDNQVATAKQYPRSLSKFRQTATQMVSLDPETAESCIYVRPVGKKLVNGKWEQEYAEGPSIRAAEIVAASYTNLRCKVSIIEQTDRFVRVEAQAWDMENNVAASIQRIETTVKKTGELYSETQRNLTALAAMAKAWRDAVFKVVPRALFKPVMDIAKSVASGNVKTLAERRSRAAAWVASLKLDAARVFAALGVKGWDDTTEANLETMTGLKTSIKDGDVTIDEAFPPLLAAPQTSHIEQEAKETTEGKKAAPSQPRKQEQASKEAKTESPKEEKAPETGPKPEPKQEEPDKPAEKPHKKAEKQETEPANDRPMPTDGPGFLEAIYDLALKSEVKIPQVIGFLKDVKIMRKEQTALGDLSTAKLADLYKGWAKALPFIQKQKA